MAHAEITLPDGITVNVDGSPDEISAVVDRLKGAPQVGKPTQPVAKAKAAAVRSKPNRTRVQIGDLLEDLMAGGFFATPKELGAVKAALAEMGHHYPRTTLSPTMLRLVRKKDLRRLKENKRWVYTR